MPVPDFFSGCVCVPAPTLSVKRGRLSLVRQSVSVGRAPELVSFNHSFIDCYYLDFAVTARMRTLSVCVSHAVMSDEFVIMDVCIYM